MKFTSDGLSLAEAVLKVSKACAVRTTAPVMECIKVTAHGDYVSPVSSYSFSFTPLPSRWGLHQNNPIPIVSFR